MTTENKPIIVVSKCLGFDSCRFNGQMIEDEFVRKLERYIQFFPVCPEVEVGLGIPRFPVRLVQVGIEERLIQPSTGVDITPKMKSFIAKFKAQLDAVDGFIFKNRSPSCGPGDVKVYQHVDKPIIAAKSGGLFANAMNQLFPGTAIEDEGRLRNFKIREHFLTKLFTLARFRKVKSVKKAGKLVEFQATHKFLLLAHSQKHLRLLGKVVANHEKLPISEQLDLYEENLFLALKTPPRRMAFINVMQHMAGFFSKQSSTREKRFFEETLTLYREGRIPLSSVIAVVKTWTLREENEYLLNQVIMAPFPADLIELKDSGRLLDL
jgi:uncharacterized protein YbgA (DUF1722 family)/uncharacterized protein YbbK (DUF523 family)